MSFSDHMELKTFSEASCIYNLRTGGKSFSKMLLLKVCESFLYRHNTETWSAKVWICFEKKQFKILIVSSPKKYSFFRSSFK